MRVAPAYIMGTAIKQEGEVCEVEARKMQWVEIILCEVDIAEL